MQFIICDDNKEFVFLLEKELKELEPECVVRSFYSVKQLMFSIPDFAGSTDAIFMDIELSGENGIDTAVKIAKEYPNIRIVYVTGYGDKYSQDIFNCPSDISPAAFLVKPVSKKYLKNAIERIRSTGGSDPLIPFKIGRNKVFVKPDDIRYISVIGRKISVFTTKGILETNGTLSACMKELPDGFVQCHKSYCVNIRHIKAIRSWREILITNENVLPVSRSYCENFRATVARMHSELPK